MAAEITGYALEELLGRIGYELLLPDGRPPEPDCSSVNPVLGRTECSFALSPARNIPSCPGPDSLRNSLAQADGRRAGEGHTQSGRAILPAHRSEERRVGKECRSRW